MKKLLALLALFSVGISADPRINKLITITSGTPIQLSSFHLYATEIFIQAQHGGTGLIQICVGMTTTPAANCATSGQLTAELAPATATAPGGSYSDNVNGKQGTGIDLMTVWVDGSNSGDHLIISYLQQN